MRFRPAQDLRYGRVEQSCVRQIDAGQVEESEVSELLLRDPLYTYFEAEEIPFTLV